MPKRKPDQPKFYGVRVGRKPGVYENWDLCRQQVESFKGALHKSFPTREQAAAFVAGEDVNVPGTALRYYALAVGRTPGIFTDWQKCQDGIRGVLGAKWRKFDSREEAESWLKSEQATKKPTAAPSSKAGAGTVIAPLEISSDEDQDDDDTPEVAPPPPKKAKITSQPATKPASKAAGKVTSAGGVGKVAVVYTDGSSLRNGKVGAAAGVGVYFGEDDPRNISEPLRGNPQTNQRAELMAILRCLEVLGDSPAEIWSDSQYSIKCLTEWYKNWERNGWKATSGGAVKNVDIIKPIREKLDAREKKGVRTQFFWVKGHDTNPGNIAADMLAVAGARMAS